MNSAALEAVLVNARALMEAVGFDDSGSIIGGQYMGGNGGLLSRETMKVADALRLALQVYEQTIVPPTPDVVEPGEASNGLN